MGPFGSNIKKILIIIGILLLIGAGFAVYKFQVSKTTSSNVSEFSGTIREIKDNRLVVQSDDKTIEFQITNLTKLNRVVLTITPEQLKSHQTFTPQTKQEVGAITDFKVGQNIIVYSKDNLEKIQSANADQINYVLHAQP